MNLTRRPRRLRTTAAMRSLVAETTLRPAAADSGVLRSRRH